MADYQTVLITVKRLSRVVPRCQPCCRESFVNLRVIVLAISGSGSVSLAKMKKAAPSTPSIQSLDRGITILEAVAKSSHPVPIGQIRELLGINRSTVFRLANTLPRRGLLANPEGRGEYVVGPAIWRVFRNYDWSMSVSFCRHHLKELSNLTGETAHLGIREGR